MLESSVRKFLDSGQVAQYRENTKQEHTMSGLGSSLLPLLAPDPPTPAESRALRRFTCSQTLAYWATRSGPASLAHQWTLDLLNQGRGVEYFGSCCTITDPENWASAVDAFRSATTCPRFAWVDGQPTVS